MAEKKIKKWEPDDFELEMTTHGSFPKRGDWATHDAKWRGNWSPYIPRNIMLRYSQEGDLVLDQFAGGGTTLVEAKLLNRDIIGVDVNDIALERCREKTAFDIDSATGKVYIKKGCLPVALEELKNVLGKKKVFIVTDTFLYEHGYTKPITNKLDEMGIEHTTFFNVTPDPTLACAMEGAKMIQAFKPDCILAVGGGSDRKSVV